MKYEAPKGDRLARFFWGVEVHGHTWYPEIRRWIPDRVFQGLQPRDEFPEGCTLGMSLARCHTLRAFRRMLRKHPHIRGKARLINNFKGYDVYDSADAVRRFVERVPLAPRFRTLARTLGIKNGEE